MTDKELEIKIDKAIKDELTSNDGYMPFFPNSEFAISLRNRLVKLFSIPDVSLSFEAKEKIIDLHGYVTEIEEVDGDVVWFYDQNGEYMSLRKEYVKRYSS